MDMKKNLAKQKLQAGETIYGVISPTTDPIIAEYCGFLGFDYYMIDGEHGAISPNDIPNIVRACEVTGITPLARIRNIDAKLILQFFDAGIMGVMMPSIRTVEDVKNLVEAVKYPPLGERGLGPVRSADYLMSGMSQAEYVEMANAETLILPQVEDLHCVNHLEEMTQIPGVDGFIVGPRDLAMSMGYYDGPGHEAVKETIDQIFETVKKSNLYIGTVAGTGEQAQAIRAKGANIVLNSVAGLLKQSAQQFLAEAKK